MIGTLSYDTMTNEVFTSPPLLFPFSRGCEGELLIGEWLWSSTAIIGNN